MRPILLVGSEGSMGKRYQAILNYLGRTFLPVDIETSKDIFKHTARVVDGAIIASPTKTHFTYISELFPLKIPILCEKPVTKDPGELGAILDGCWEYETPLRMMYQYSMLTEPNDKGDSEYDYFRSGKDGLVWDCLQIIGLSKSEPYLRSTSPVWKCSVNGRKLSLSDMDRAYVDYVQQWFKTPNQDPSEISDIHQKTQEMAKKWQNS